LEELQVSLVEQDGSLILPRHQTEHRGTERDPRKGRERDDSPMASNEAPDPLERLGQYVGGCCDIQVARHPERLVHVLPWPMARNRRDGTQFRLWRLAAAL